MNRLLVAAAAAFVASGAVLAQPELAVAPTDPEQQLVDRITQMRAEDGSTSAALIEPLRALALLHQENGDDALAAAVFEEARYVTRVHHGLSSIDEALLLRQQLRSERAIGDYERVWDLEQDMVTIARQHLDDIRTAPIFRELGDDRLETLRKYQGGEFSPELYLGCYYAAGLPRYDDTRGERRATHDRSCDSGSKGAAMGLLRAEVLMYYADAIDVILKNGDFASQELRDLEQQALRIGSTVEYPALPSLGNAVTKGGVIRLAQGRCVIGTLDELLALDVLGTCLQPVIHANGIVIANVGGWVSLVRLRAYEILSGAPATARAEAVAELADWLLFTTPAGRRPFERNSQRALELYERLYRELEQDRDLRASVTEVFSPDVPVTLPTFVPNPFASAATAESSRYIDVAFAVTEHGRGERIEILATSNEATRTEEKDVVHLIEGTTFRPRVVDGELAAAAPVVLRYYLTPRTLQDARDVRLWLCEREGVCRP
jgi:hypothetical protein